MENYLPLLEKIVSELVTAKRNNENNLAAGKIVNFKNNRLVRAYLRYANSVVKDAVARGQGHKISRARIEYDILGSIDKENFPLEFKLACTSIIMHSDTFEVFWLGLRDLFQLPGATIERLQPNFELIEELDAPSAAGSVVSTSDDSSTSSEDSTPESSNEEEEVRGREERIPVNEAPDSGFWFKSKTPPPPPPPSPPKSKKLEPEEEEEEEEEEVKSPSPRPPSDNEEEGEDKFAGAAMSSIDRPAASGTKDATTNSQVVPPAKAGSAARRGAKKPAARKTTTRAAAAAKRKAEEDADDDDNDNDDEVTAGEAADGPVRPTAGGKTVQPPEPRGTKRKAAGTGRGRGGRAKRGRTA
ncbi:hypothetical protein M432DRAFT_45555 [Thermoascus aurantiacus ATCC 26904]